MAGVLIMFSLKTWRRGNKLIVALKVCCDETLSFEESLLR